METMNSQDPIQFCTNEEKQFAMFIHLSQLLGYAFPFFGWVVPLVLWQMKKNTSTYIDTHGKIVMNWIISSFIYGIIAGILAFMLIGIPILVILAACSVIFAIVGGIKANDGETWFYPLSITFIR